MKVSRAKLEKLTSLLRKQFSNKIEINQNIRIFFENIDEEWLCLLIGKFIAAKGIQDKTTGCVYAINSKEDTQYEELSQSFGYSTTYIQKNVTFAQKAMAYIFALLFCKIRNSGENILKINYRGTHIGDLIYDYLIRASLDRKYTINKIETREQFQILVEGFLYAIYFDNYFRSNKPSYFIAGDIIYLKGIIVRTAMKHGAKIIEFCTGKYVYEIESTKYNSYEPNYHLCCVERMERYRQTLFTSNWELEVENKLRNIFLGIGDWNTKEAYGNKKSVSKEEILGDLKIGNKKKNIVIMAHCFSDSPHCSGKYIYKDYYEWLVETLKIVKELDNVNWIVKPHPCRKYYGENGIVENLFKEYKSSSLYWMPDEYSANMIPIFADAIITVSGTGGLEFSCCGVPCINLGNPFYSYYGISINVNSVAEYKKILRNLHRIRCLSEEKIKKAKEILYLYSKISGFSNDSLQKCLNTLYYEYRQTHETYKNNNDTIDTLIKWAEKNSMIDSDIYKEGYTIGV